MPSMIHGTQKIYSPCVITLIWHLADNAPVLPGNLTAVAYKVILY